MKRFWPFLLFSFFILLPAFYLGYLAFTFFSPFLPYTPYLLGLNKPTSYLVLLGNDAEMRANGGFTGSYAKITISPSTIPSFPFLDRHAMLAMTKPNINISFQDIYVPNGQIKGLFVTPPEPIQQAFGHGTWELANADWEPDFPGSAKTIRWFLEKGGEINPDNLILLNLSTIKKILAVIGSFSVPEYRATLTPDNLYLFLQGKVELDFFPGSTQKKDALTAVGRALFQKVKTLSLFQKIRLARILYQDFQDQNLLINSTDSSFQQFLVGQNLAGVFQPEAFDTYSLIEMNLGANKANAYVTRQTTHQISFQNSAIHHQVAIQFTNSSPAQNPNPPFHYGGDYHAYLRLYLPQDAQNISLTRTPVGKPPLASASDSATIRPQYGLTEIGFWHTTLAGDQSSIDLSYDLPLADQKAYTLAIIKQHGLTTSPQTLNLFGQSFTTPLNHSFRYP